MDRCDFALAIAVIGSIGDIDILECPWPAMVRVLLAVADCEGASWGSSKNSLESSCDEVVSFGRGLARLGMFEPHYSGHHQMPLQHRFTLESFKACT